MTDGHKEKPCIALMGEFSAGKSTLANLLIGYDPLPVQVVATQLPPVRIVYGEGEPFQIGLDGERAPVDLDALDRSSLKATAYLQIYSQEEFLRHCDLIDMPGISDPNMPADVWERMIGEADGVIWCSPATQAWRQSEAAVWSSLPDELYPRSLLLLTRMDKLMSQSDRDRVLSRVKQETEGMFADVLPISLLLATREQENYALWKQSGAEALAKRLTSILTDISAGAGKRNSFAVRLTALEAPNAAIIQEKLAEAPANKVLPRRPVAARDRTARPVRGQPANAAPHWLTARMRANLTEE
jgi:GTPase SAR1 family protein